MPRMWLGLWALATVVIFPQWAGAAGPAIDEVWMRYGGGRPYYDSIMEPRQMDMNGMRRRDPALIRNLPPITAYPVESPRRMSSRKSSTPATVMPVQASTPKSGMPPAGQATSAKPNAPVAPPAVTPVPKVTAPVSAAPAVAPPAAVKATDGLAPPTRNGSIARPEDKDQVFMAPPPAAKPAVPAGAAATSAMSGASTKAAGAGGTMQGVGTTTNQGQATRAPVPAGATPAGARP